MFTDETILNCSFWSIGPFGPYANCPMLEVHLRHASKVITKLILFLLYIPQYCLPNTCDIGINGTFQGNCGQKESWGMRILVNLKGGSHLEGSARTGASDPRWKLRITVNFHFYLT